MTTSWRRVAIAAAAMIAAAVVAGAACGKARSSGGNNGGAAISGANEQVVNPYGFTIQITGLVIPMDPTSASTPPTVTFVLKDENGAPITDLKAELGNAPNGSTPAAGYPYINAPRFTLARLDADGTYNAQYVTGTGGATMATSVTLPRDPAQFDARVTSNADGSYTFKLNPLTASPTSDERARTWTVGTWASRRPSQGTPADEAASSTGNFVPAGGTPTTKQVVALGACNTCHAPAVRAHGTRLGVQLCLTCHTAQTHDRAGTSVEFVELIHKIHYGADRPGPTYTIIGFQNSENTFDDEWINDVRSCTLCHQGANADRHVNAPSQRACTTCHSVVHFDGSAAATCATNKKDTTDCNHQAGPQPDSACATCHTPSGIPAQHTSIFTIAQGWKYEIKGATVGADRKPTIQFDVLDTTSNSQPRDLANDPSYKAPAASLNVQIGWSSKDYNNAGSGAAAPGQPRSIAIVRGGSFNPSGSNVTTVAGQANVYQVTSPVALPDGVASFTVFMDGHPVARGENIPVTNAVQTFGVSGGAGDARRTVVSVQSCNVCHGTLSWHGRNRNGTVEACVVCHNPHATDWQKRQGTAGASQPESPVDFKVLIHAVHSADIRHGPLTVYEFNAANAAHGGAPGTPEDFPGTIPHGVANCNLCHVNASYEPPISADAQDTTIDTKNTPMDPSDDVTMPKTQAVCTSCHDQTHFDSGSSSLPACSVLHPVNSQACFHTGGAQPTEANCATCHGRGGPFDVTAVHDVQ